jgi:hypothetical protein
MKYSRSSSIIRRREYIGSIIILFKDRKIDRHTSYPLLFRSYYTVKPQPIKYVTNIEVQIEPEIKCAEKAI